MRAYAVDALILRTYRYGEADRIVVFLTEDRGKKRGVAKNATKSRRRFGAALDPLTRGHVAYVEREHRELVRLDRIEPKATALSAASGRQSEDGAQALGYAAYFAELIDAWSPDGAPNGRLFRLGVAVGAALGPAPSIDALARYFEYWLLRLEGVYPALDRCPRCERPTMSAGAVLVIGERTLVCDECGHGGLRLSAPAVAFLKQAGRRTPLAMASAGTPAGPLHEIEQVHGRLMAAHLEKELRSARVVRELRPQQ